MNKLLNKLVEQLEINNELMNMLEQIGTVPKHTSKFDKIKDEIQRDQARANASRIKSPYFKNVVKNKPVKYVEVPKYAITSRVDNIHKQNPAVNKAALDRYIRRGGKV
jgi:hypothetical protein